jgi:hypothetical protein
MWPFRRRPAPAVALPVHARLLTAHAITTMHAVVDDLAEAFAADPVRMTLLLGGHAGTVFALDAMVADPGAADHELAMAAAEANGTRAALLALPPAATNLTRTTAQETDR